MSVYLTQPTECRKHYAEMLSLMGALSRLFSESKKPYLDSRVTENLFCRCLQATNLARNDCTADARLATIGVGIKTWVAGSALQKIAEFNKLRPRYRNLSGLALAREIAGFRNDRIVTTVATYGLKDFIYHCTIRDINTIKIVECPLQEIAIQNIRIIKESPTSLIFEDGINEYNFNLSKSVLMKRFVNMEVLDEIPVSIVEDPFELLRDLISRVESIPTVPVRESMVLPLYATQKDEKKIVYERSGLNIRNAGGRKRDRYEIYIRIPSKAKKAVPNFFPDSSTPFRLLLPDGNELKAKICQQGDKALMSNPNKALGHWLLRDVLRISPDDILTYDRLCTIGIDAVVIEKLDATTFTINFAKIGSYEKFLEEHNVKVC